MRSLLMPLVAAFALSGCAGVSTIEIGQDLHPRPNTPFTTVAPQSLALILDPSIVDKVTLPGDWAYETQLTAWRRTLINGYMSGLGVYFSPVPAGQPADLALDIVKADVAWTPPGSRLTVQITYKAQLIDRNGNTVAVVANTVTAKHALTNDDGAEADCVNSAVESLYEDIATTLVRPAVPLNGSQG